ncbi:DUF397 domain-containing protein [Streptomyces paludis]|uniref:DUF397 domain-containing protein n=1 Tax=Streptomyces paludis TaxID=2282738 RepID=A0A345HJ45_9ACTN|nr:DUF397 domain-containing protein [Streptomyces paludis]AXG76719.1 DUF397 domain-containing protein [Streptomyces paludis]
MNREREDLFTASLDGQWVTSSLSGPNGDACVRVMKIAGGFAVDDSKSPDRPPLRYTHAQMRAFLLAVEAGAFDQSVQAPPRP